MQKIGLVGGIGPASTVSYYMGLIEKTKKELGDNVYPEIVIDSVDMQYATECFEKEEYEKSVEYIVKSVSNLQAAGAELAAITANTEHILWDKMKDFFPIPVISIVDAAVKEIKRLGYQKVFVLGSVFTMKSGLYEKAFGKNGIVAILPSLEDKEVIGKLIYPNLENGIVVPEDRAKMIAIVEKYLAREEVDVVLLACTEISLAIKEGDLSKPILDTTQIHIQAIFDEMC